MSTQTTNNKQGTDAGGAFSLLTMIYWFQTGKLATAFSPESSFTDSLLTLLSSYTECKLGFLLLFLALLYLLLWVYLLD